MHTYYLTVSVGCRLRFGLTGFPASDHHQGTLQVLAGVLVSSKAWLGGRSTSKLYLLDEFISFWLYE